MDFANGSNNSFTILLLSLANGICAKVNRSQDDLAALFCGRRWEGSQKWFAFGFWVAFGG